MKISVIIAAYNAEKYLRETLESVVMQEFDDFEVIAVDDGSTDTTASIVKEFSSNYPMIKLLQKENGGPGSARNVGMKAAIGEYLFFLDADDILAEDGLKRLYNKAVEENADMVIGAFDQFDEHKTYEAKRILSLLSKAEINKYDQEILWTFVLWNKLFKKSLVDQTNIIFPDLIYSEDGVFTMRCVYQAKKIVGILDVVLHYRRMREETNSAITAHIDMRKLRDYIKSHELIYQSAEERLEDDKNEKQLYLSHVLCKELAVLLNHFYGKFWDNEEKIIKEIVTEIQKKLPQLSSVDYSILANRHPEFHIYDLPLNYEKGLERILITGVLYAEMEQKEKLFLWLDNFYAQTLVPVQVVLPESMKETVKSAGYQHANILFEKAESQEKLFETYLKKAKSDYIIFCNLNIHYASDAWKAFYYNAIRQPADFLVNKMYHSEAGELQPIALHADFIKRMSVLSGDGDDVILDNLWANKMFRVSFLQNIQISFQIDRYREMKKIYQSGYGYLLEKEYTIFKLPEEEYINFIRSKEAAPRIEEYLKTEENPLNAEFLKENTEKSRFLLRRINDKTKKNRWKRSFLSYIQKLPMKKQVLFYSIRTDGKLEGNAAALYPYVEGKKKISAKRLPHSFFQELKMMYETAISKVIITDDYQRYLINYPLKEGQRVIQLWHACGAFKKFGRRGTNLNIDVDRSVHAQDSLVCVSGEAVRSIYADAFDIDYRKVQALGCPRTDSLFDSEILERSKQKVYQLHPELKGKEILLYAPTFRDTKDGRETFRPQIDFLELSKNLLENQVFVICPHPLMKNAVLDKKYANILEIRDIPTSDMMVASSLMVTDYSSVIFEYVLLKKPVIFYCYDLKKYNRGFYLNYPKDLPGEVFQKQNELTAYLTSEQRLQIDERYMQFQKKYMSACDGNSAERIGKIINQYMKG